MILTLSEESTVCSIVLNLLRTVCILSKIVFTLRSTLLSLPVKFI